jgi:predicted O-methyltransferase YrrM
MGAFTCSAPKAVLMLITDKIAALDIDNKSHAAGAFTTLVLRRLEQLMPRDMARTAETGCGKSTILFSNLSRDHTVFTIDDSVHGENSSLHYFRTCALTQADRVQCVLGPTQQTLPAYNAFGGYDAVLIDGPHGYPFPELEYYYFYPHIKTGGLLIVDDVHIATIGRLADFIAEDAMFELVEMVVSTAVFRRTDAPVFDPLGDGWWEQDFNRRRIQADQPNLAQFALKDAGMRAPFAASFGDPVARPRARPYKSSVTIGSRIFDRIRRRMRGI